MPDDTLLFQFVYMELNAIRCQTDLGGHFLLRDRRIFAQQAEDCFFGSHTRFLGSFLGSPIGFLGSFLGSALRLRALLKLLFRTRKYDGEKASEFKPWSGTFRFPKEPPDLVDAGAHVFNQLHALEQRCNDLVPASPSSRILPAAAPWEVHRDC